MQAEAQMQEIQMAKLRRWEEERLAKMTEEERAAEVKVVFKAL